MFEKVKNVAKKAGEKVNAFWGKVKLAVCAGFIGLTGLLVGLTGFVCYTLMTIAVISVIALVGVFFMTVLASVAIFLASALGLSTGWAVAFFVAFVLLIWH